MVKVKNNNKKKPPTSVLIPLWGVDQNELFDSIMRGKYEFDDEYWSDISDEGKNFNGNESTSLTCCS
jgi:hypothetical protein